MNVQLSVLKQNNIDHSQFKQGEPTEKKKENYSSHNFLLAVQKKCLKTNLVAPTGVG